MSTPIVSKDQMNQALSDWRKMNEFIQAHTEEECWKLLKEEQKGGKRLDYLLRIYGRANKLRSTRERRAIAAGEPL